MYLSGGSDCGCGGGLGDYMGDMDYLGGLGQETPWWEQLIYTGEKIATNVLQQPKMAPIPTYGGTYGTYTTPPMFPASYPPIPYAAPPPGPIAGETNWLPYLLVGGLALYLLTR